MELKLLEGTVQRFSDGTGFVILANGGSLVFDISGFEFLRAFADQVKWAPLPQGVTFREPQPGEVLVFELGTDGQGLPRVGRWTRKGILVMAQKHAIESAPLAPAAPVKPASAPAAKPIEPIYRLTTSLNGGEPREDWRGRSSDDPNLSKFWIPGENMTFGHEDFGTMYKQFQRSDDGGITWVNVDPPQHAPDPRRRR